MLCTELRESVSATYFSSLFLLAHLSATRIAISSGEYTLKLSSNLDLYVAFSSGTTNEHRILLFSVSLLPSVYSLNIFYFQI